MEDWVEVWIAATLASGIFVALLRGREGETMGESAESVLRFEIREAEDGSLYFALVFTYDGKMLMASESYGDGIGPLINDMDIVRSEAAGAAELNRTNEGAIPGVAPLTQSLPSKV